MTESVALQRRLDLLLGRHPIDALFTLVERLSTGSDITVPIPISLIVSGFLIRGHIVRPLDTASSLDSMLHGLLERATINVRNAEGTDSEEVREALSEALSRPFEQIAESVEERLRAATGVVDSEEEFSIDHASDDTFEQALPALLPAGIIDLADAEMQLPDGRWQRIGAIRVMREAVSAWWGDAA